MGRGGPPARLICGGEIAHALDGAEAEHRYVYDIFAALGVPEDHAGAVAELVTQGDLRGHGSHGLIRVPLYSGLARSGRARVEARPRIVQERVAAALLDGDQALGPYAAIIASYEAMARARGTGVAAVAFYNCGHIGLAGHYVELAARQDLIGILFAKSEASVHPHGGSEPMIGTNPVRSVSPPTAIRCCWTWPPALPPWASSRKP